MGLGRFIRHLIAPSTVAIDVVKNAFEEGSVVEGLKRTVKEDITEDNPVTKALYKYGKYDGKIEGYKEASTEYEKKLLYQADQFLEQIRDYEKERDEYEKLLDAYEKEIIRLEKKSNRTSSENELLKQLLIRKGRLKDLAIA